MTLMTSTLPVPRTTIFDLFVHPARLGQLASRVRDQLLGPEIQICEAPPLLGDRPHAVIREGVSIPQPDWPRAEDIRSGDRWVLAIEPGPEQRVQWLDWIDGLAAATPPGCSLAPYSRARGGTHRLWCIAAARLRLPAAIRIEARHDLIDVRLSQIALGFGADTVAGPIVQDRRLPVAGVTRPDETTRAGLQSLVQWAGLPVLDTSPTLPSEPQ